MDRGEPLAMAPFLVGIRAALFLVDDNLLAAAMGHHGGKHFGTNKGRAHTDIVAIGKQEHLVKGHRFAFFGGVHEIETESIAGLGLNLPANNAEDSVHAVHNWFV